MLLEKLLVAQLIDKFSAFYRTQNFTTDYRRSRNSLIYPSHIFIQKINIILPVNCVFHSGIPTKRPSAFVNFPMYATYPSLLFLNHCDSNQQRLKIITYFPVQFFSVFLSLLVFLSPNYLLGTLFSSALVLFAFHVINEVPYHYETSGNIITQPSSVMGLYRYSLEWQLTSRERQTNTRTSEIHFYCWVWHFKRKCFRSELVFTCVYRIAKSGC